MNCKNQTCVTRLVKNSLTLVFFLFLFITGHAQNVGINGTGSVPNPAAGLDVDFPDKGVLLPRIALTGTSGSNPLPAHVAGMIVYNTATTGDVTPGLYYDDGTRWVKGLPTGISVGDMLYWNGTDWVRIPVGTSGQYLQMDASNIPFWGGGAFATLSTNAATSITATTAVTGGDISSDGGAAVLARGVCYNTSANPTTANSLLPASPSTGIGPFTSNLTGLLSGTTYYVRAYATNSSVTSYGPGNKFYDFS